LVYILLDSASMWGFICCTSQDILTGLGVRAWAKSEGVRRVFFLPVLVLIFILIPHLIYVTPSYPSVLTVSHIIAPIANQFYRIISVLVP